MTKREENDMVDLAVALLRVERAVADAKGCWARMVTPDRYSQLWAQALSDAHEEE